jgi:hypothetical protein
MNDGTTPETAKIVNLKDPVPSLKMQMKDGRWIDLDMTKFKEAAERLGLGGIQKGDVLSIDSHRNAKGVWEPNYDSIRIEREASS